MRPKNLVVYRERSSLISAAAQLIAGAIRETLRQNGTCRFGLAGGTTPEPVYQALADPRRVGDLPFDRIEVLFGDERCVPPDDPESNYAMARRAFGVRFDAFKAVHRIRGELERTRAATEYGAVVRTPIDVLLLGMGPDAHIASLFPGSGVFSQNGDAVVAVECPKPPPWRITIAPEVIRAATEVFVLAAGEAKARALEAVFTAPVDPLQRPAQLVLFGTWIVDAAAAASVISTS